MEAAGAMALLKSDHPSPVAQAGAMLNMTAFGMFHTLLGLLAVAAGGVAYLRHGGILHAQPAGRWFFWLTVATCVTGFFIFHHGGFGKPHVLGILTLVVLAVGWQAERRLAQPGWPAYLATTCYSLAFFFHFIPGLTETLTRLPVSAPWASGPDDPRLLRLVGSVFAIFLVGLAWQLWRLRGRRAAGLTQPG